MSAKEILVGIGETRIKVEAARTEWKIDGGLCLYDDDDVQIGEFPSADWCALAESVQ